ncbi:hypothetical protein HPB52_001702 [Rhipicephalus sanguineus]|uniref:Uncharacterized protein n=1 Tax=Rhipicephalus sanguineus TaxID=34632 RepID=A0A9D4PTL8_RHISA|nr:hypothetical protein HPB52_001702 [Rhipicephalus sanguineus]
MPGRQARTHGRPGSSASTTSNGAGHGDAAASNPRNNDQETTKETMDTDDQDSKTRNWALREVSPGIPHPSRGDDDEARNGQWQLALSLRERKRLKKQARTLGDPRQDGDFQQAGSLGRTKKMNNIASVGDETRRDSEKNAGGSYGRPGLAHVSRRDASGAMRGRRRSRATPLPKNDMKIIIRPKPGLVEQVAEKILQIKALDLNKTRHPVNTYISTSEGFLKGVVHGLECETPEELLNHLRGHRTDVCPTPTVNVCSDCRLQDPPIDHECVPECTLRGGAHPTAAKECANRLKRVP